MEEQHSAEYMDAESLEELQKKKLRAEIRKLNVEADNFCKLKNRARYQVWTPAIITVLSIGITAWIFFTNQSYDVNKKLLEIQSDSLNLKISLQVDTFNSLKHDAQNARQNLAVYVDSVKSLKIEESTLQLILDEKSKKASDFQKIVFHYKVDSTKMADRFKKRFYTKLELNTSKDELLQRISDQESRYQEMVSLTNDFITTVGQGAYQIVTNKDTTVLSHVMYEANFLSRRLRQPYVPK